jgi:phage terminase large subunit
MSGQSRPAWSASSKWHRQLPEALKANIDVQAERVVVVQDPEAAFAVRRTASKDNPEALQGFHAEHLLFLIDEASGIPDIVFEVGMGALSTPGAKVVMAGNPTRTSGFFYDTHHSLRDRWHTMHVNCLDVPRAQGHIEDIKAKYGESSNAYRVRVLGEFPTADDETVIPLELVLGAVGRNVSSLEYYPVWGVDVARFGDDRTALAKRQANKLLEPVKSWNALDLMATAGKLKAEYDATPNDLKPGEILIDSIGLGAGVLDRCQELRLPVRICAREVRATQRRIVVQGQGLVPGQVVLHAARRRPYRRADGSHIRLHINGEDGRRGKGRHEEARHALT